MSYDYSSRTVFVGQLAAERHPGLYEFCRSHIDGLVPPKGWTLRREPLVAVTEGQGEDDLWASAPKIAAKRSVI